MTFEIVELPNGHLTWWLMDENGAVLARSLASYRNADHLHEAIDRVRSLAHDASVVDTTVPAMAH